MMEFQARKSFSAFLEENPTYRGFHSAPVTPHRSPASPPSPAITPPRRSLQILPYRLSTSPAQESPSLLYHCLASFPCQDGAVHAIALAGRGRLVLTGGDSDCVTAWSQPDLTVRERMRTRRPRVLALLAHSDMLFTAHGDRRVRIWTVTTSSASSTLALRWWKTATFPPRRLRFSLFRWQGRSKEEHRDEVTCLALFIAGELLYTGSWDRTVKVWHVRDGTCVDSFVAHEGRVNAVAVGQDDGGVFTAGLDGCVKVWRRVYGEKTHALSMVLRFQSSPVNALVIGAGEGYFYSGSSDGYINIWEREAITGRYAVLCLAAVERLVLSGSEDTTIRVWRREEGCGFHVCLAVMEGHRGPVRCIAVGVEMENVEGSGMGLLVYSASLDRVLKAWRLKVVGCDDKQLEAEKDKRKVAGGRSPANMEDEAVLEEGEVVEPAPERWGVGEESGMNPVLSPLWVEKKTQQTVHLY
ncbi:Zinc finger CCCH domain-containing protein 59 [Platanthera zijinensis]|uniref:Zinc finger CCCH domain-containing protein 59 n=1 Tax=Platanthera zijinensis TaxID=2320716 RepID=A0AAP0ASL6_9ASPA